MNFNHENTQILNDESIAKGKAWKIIDNFLESQKNYFMHKSPSTIHYLLVILQSKVNEIKKNNNIDPDNYHHHV